MCKISKAIKLLGEIKKYHDFDPNLLDNSGQALLSLQDIPETIELFYDDSYHTHKYAFDEKIKNPLREALRKIALITYDFPQTYIHDYNPVTDIAIKELFNTELNVLITIFEGIKSVAESIDNERSKKQINILKEEWSKKFASSLTCKLIKYLDTICIFQNKIFEEAIEKIPNVVFLMTMKDLHL